MSSTWPLLCSGIVGALSLVGEKLCDLPYLSLQATKKGSRFVCVVGFGQVSGALVVKQTC
jgi:hypothetical protein